MMTAKWRLCHVFYSRGCGFVVSSLIYLSREQIESERKGAEGKNE